MLIIAWMLAATAIGQGAATEPSALEGDALRQLLTIRRVYVDRLNGGETAGQMRDIIIASLQKSRLFVITENQDKADAVLRGSAEDLVFTEQHSMSDNINARANIGLSRNSGYAGNSRYGGGRNGSSEAGGIGIGEGESMHSFERRHEATAAVRLVNKDGDVIWSTTEESLGGKFRGSSADVADKISSKLLEDYGKARKLARQ